MISVARGWGLGKVTTWGLRAILVSDGRSVVAQVLKVIHPAGLGVVMLRFRWTGVPVVARHRLTLGTPFGRQFSHGGCRVFV